MTNNPTKPLSRSDRDQVRWSRWGVDLGLLGCLVLTPLALGGRHDMGRLVYASSVALAAISMAAGAMASGRSLRLPSTPLLLALAAVSVVAFQLVPLPASWLAGLAPGHGALLPLWSVDTPFGPWRTVSLAPAETLEGLAVLASHALLFLVVLNRIDSPSDLQNLLRWVAGAALAMAALAVAQSAFPSDRLLWLYDHPARSFAHGLQGSFANRNHLAHFLVLGVAALSAFAVGESAKAPRSRRRSAKPERKASLAAYALALIVVLVVVTLATKSRGGAVGLAAAVLVAAGIRWRAGRLRLVQVIALAGVIVSATAGLSLFGYEGVAGRLDDLVSGEIEELDSTAGRRLIWAANARAFLANPWLGHGAGSHKHVYPSYIDGPSALEFTHAESSYLQIATENGIGGLAVLCLGIGAVLACVLRRPRPGQSEADVALWAALGAGIAASLVHAVVDFVWYIPALAAGFVFLSAAAWRLRELQDPPATEHCEPLVSDRLPAESSFAWATSWGTVATASFCLACLFGPALGSIDADRYRRASKTARSLAATRFASPAAEADPQLGSSILAAEERALGALESALVSDSNNARLHACLANRYQRRFERLVAAGANPMTIDAIRDTAVNGGFGSTSQLREWLAQAFGDAAPLLGKACWHAQKSVRLCPLEAGAYLQLGALAFLDSDPQPVESLVEQAVRVRSYDGGIRYEAGRQTHLLGDTEAAFKEYKACLRLPGSHRVQLVAFLASVFSAESLIELLEPDASTIDLFLTTYGARDSKADLIVFAEYARRSAEVLDSGETPSRAARRWRQLSLVNRTLGRAEEAVRCATHAYELSPSEFWIRFELAAALFAVEQYDDADTHVRWCFARRPDMRQLEAWLHAASKQRRLARRDPKRSFSAAASAEAIAPSTSTTQPGQLR